MNKVYACRVVEGIGTLPLCPYCGPDGQARVCQFSGRAPVAYRMGNETRMVVRHVCDNCRKSWFLTTGFVEGGMQDTIAAVEIRPDTSCIPPYSPSFDI